MIDRAEKQGQMTSDEREQILRADETRDRKKPVVAGQRLVATSYYKTLRKVILKQAI